MQLSSPFYLRLASCLTDLKSGYKNKMYIIHLSDLRLSDKNKDNAAVVCQGIVDAIKALISGNESNSKPTQGIMQGDKESENKQTENKSPPSTPTDNQQITYTTATYSCIITGLIFEANIAPQIDDVAVFTMFIKAISKLCPIIIF